MQSSLDQHSSYHLDYQNNNPATSGYHKHYPGTTQSTTTVFQKLDSRQFQASTGHQTFQSSQNSSKQRPQTSQARHYNSAANGIGNRLQFQNQTQYQQSGQIQLDQSKSSKSNFFQFSLKNDAQYYNSQRQTEAEYAQIGAQQQLQHKNQVATRVVNVSDDSEKNEEPSQIGQDQSLPSKWFQPNLANPYHMAKNVSSVKNLPNTRAHQGELLHDVNINDPTKTQSNFKLHNVEPLSTTMSTMSYAMRQPTAVYLLGSNELLTEDELYVGLTKIASEYGKPNSRSDIPFGRGKSHSSFRSNRKLIQKARNNLIRSAVNRDGNNQNQNRYFHNNMQAEIEINQKNAESGKYARVSSSKQTKSSTKVKNFIDRQQILHKYKEEFKASRQSLKPSGQRLIEMFPQFVDKAGSKQHSQFLFGNSNYNQVFRDFKNAMITKESDQLFNADMHAPIPHQEKESLVLQYQRQNKIPHQVFDMKVTDNEEIEFFNKIFQDAKRSSSPAGVLQNTHLQQIQERKIGADNSDLQGVTEYFETTTGNQIANKSGNPVLTHISDYDIFTDVPASQDGISKIDEPLQQKNLEGKTSHTRPKRDFLAESLAESTQIFRAQSGFCGLSSLETGSMKLIQAQKDLEGVAILDQDEVIQNFKSKVQQQTAQANEYNFLGDVPIVNPELADKYLNLKRTMREQKQRDKTEQSAISQTRENVRAISVPKKRKIIGAVGPTAAKQNRRFLRISGHEIDTILTSKGKSTPREQLKSKQQKPYVRENSSKVRLVPVDPTNHTPDKNPTIEQDNLSSSVIQDQIKCNLSLFCAKYDIKLSPEMSLDDVCYISNKELERAKQYLAAHNPEDTLLLYQNQFNSFQNGIAQKPIAQQAVQQDAATGRDSPMQKRDESGLRFSRNSTENRTQLLQEQSASQVQEQPYDSLDGQNSEVPEQPQVIDQIDNKLADLKNQYKTLYKQQKEESVSSRLKSTEPLEKKDLPVNEGINFSMVMIQGDYKDTNKPRAAKRFQTTELSDGQARKRDEESDLGGTVDPELSPIKPLNKPLKPLGPNSIVLGSESEQVAGPSKISSGGQVSFIQPVLDSKSPYEEMQSNRTPVLPQKVSDEERLPTGTSQLVAFESELNKKMKKDDEDSQLNYLGIHHVKADEWKPTADLVPCCVRCFSIVTFVLNYQLHSQEVEQKKQAM